MFVRMSVAGLHVDPSTGQPVLLLTDEAGGTLLPIGIGPAEAHAIAVHLESIRLARPMTHDLLLDVAVALDGEVVRVEVVDLVDDVFHATIVLRRGEEARLVDARPSDAVALALRAGAPIFVARAVLEAALRPPCEGEAIGTMLSGLPEGAYGKYKH